MSKMPMSSKMRRIKKRVDDIQVDEGNITWPIEELPSHLIVIQRSMLGKYVKEEYGKESEETFRAYCKKHNLIDFMDIQSHVNRKMGIARED